jgi:hypothetical protein
VTLLFSLLSGCGESSRRPLKTVNPVGPPRDIDVPSIPVTTEELDRKISGTQWNWIAIFKDGLRREVDDCQKDDIFSFNRNNKLHLDEGQKCEKEKLLKDILISGKWKIVTENNIMKVQLKVFGQLVGTLYNFKFFKDYARFNIITKDKETFDVEFRPY